MSLTKNLLFACYLCFGYSAFPASAQPGLTEEVERIVSLLVEQINAFEEIKTVAVADFTDLSYLPHPLGKRLSEEFLTSLVTAAERRFEMISRSQLKTLMEEVKFDEMGMLAPENIPKLGRIKGIDLIIGATLAPSANVVRFNILGIQLESGSLIAGAKGRIPVTPSLKPFLGDLTELEADLPTNSGPALENIPVISAGGFTVKSRGCSSMGYILQCEFSIISERADADLSIYNPLSRVVLSQDPSVSVIPQKIALGDRSGDRRITTTVSGREATNLSVVFPAPASGGSSSVAKIELVCFSSLTGTFTMTFFQMPINY